MGVLCVVGSLYCESIIHGNFTIIHGVHVRCAAQDKSYAIKFLSVYLIIIL